MLPAMFDVPVLSEIEALGAVYANPVCQKVLRLSCYSPFSVSVL
jgi:hypothetical protein